MHGNIKVEIMILNNVISYVVNDNFSYTQLAFAFAPQRNSSYSHDGNDIFFLFLLQKDFNISLGPFFTFLLFLFQKEFDIFRMLLFEAFIFIFYNS